MAPPIQSVSRKKGVFTKGKRPRPVHKVQRSTSVWLRSVRARKKKNRRGRQLIERMQHGKLIVFFSLLCGNCLCTVFLFVFSSMCVRLCVLECVCVCHAKQGRQLTLVPVCGRCAHCSFYQRFVWFKYPATDS